MTKKSLAKDKSEMIACFHILPRRIDPENVKSMSVY